MISSWEKDEAIKPRLARVLYLSVNPGRIWISYSDLSLHWLHRVLSF